MHQKLEQYDVVEVTCDLAEGFTAGTKGTIVEVLAPGVFMVEFEGDSDLVLPVVEEGQLKLIWRQGTIS